ncbi:hypothetical protein KI387_014240, partial [Taxus chinensis]
MSQGSPKQSGMLGTKVREPAEPGEMSQGSAETLWDARDDSTRTGRTGRNESRQPEKVWDARDE